jgi:hypothetical protein
MKPSTKASARGRSSARSTKSSLALTIAEPARTLEDGEACQTLVIKALDVFPEHCQRLERNKEICVAAAGVPRLAPESGGT